MEMFMKKAVRKKKPRITKASLKRELKAALSAISDLTFRLTIANKERVEFFHKIGTIEATAIEMRGEAQRIADIGRTVLGRQDQPPPPMTNMMMVTQR
jgi:hypothetical protein